MPDYYLNNYQTNCLQKALFPIFSVYAARHIAAASQAATWKGKSIHVLIALVDWMWPVALIEKAFASKNNSKKNVSAKPPSGSKSSSIKVVWDSARLRTQPSSSVRVDPKQVQTPPPGTPPPSVPTPVPPPARSSTPLVDPLPLPIQTPVSARSSTPLVDPLPLPIQTPVSARSSTPLVDPLPLPIQTPASTRSSRSLVDPLPIPAYLNAPVMPYVVRLPSPPLDIQIPLQAQQPREVIKVEMTPELREATRIVLTTPGFDPPKDLSNANYYYKKEKVDTVEEIQGTPELRKAVRAAAKIHTHVLSPEALKDQSDINFEQSLRFRIKKLTHIFDMMGRVLLPETKTEINLEGFCEDFTIPMLASSFAKFAQSDDPAAAWLKDDISAAWIIEQFLDIITNDMVYPGKVQEIVKEIQNPAFEGPCAIGTGFDWHSAIDIFFRNFLFYGNRGGGGVKGQPGIHVYLLPNRELVEDEVIETCTMRQNVDHKTCFGPQAIESELGGQHVHYQQKSSQGSGNCTHRSMETALDILMVIRVLLNFLGDSNLPEQEMIDQKYLEQAFALVRTTSDAFLKFDAEEAIRDFVEDLEGMCKDHTLADKRLGTLYTALLEQARRSPIYRTLPICARAEECLTTAKLFFPTDGVIRPLVARTGADFGHTRI